MIHFVRGDLTGPLSAVTPDSVRLYYNSDSKNALATTSFFVTDSWRVNRLTMNVGLRYDRYNAGLPAQSLPAGRFTAGAEYPERPDIVKFNHIVPRFGATYDLTGDGKTVLKANYGRFAFNPGVNLADAVSENTANQYASVAVAGPRRRPRLRRQREGRHRADAEVRRRRQHVPRSDDLENAYTDEASVFIERQVVTDLGLRVGFVWKKDYNGWQQFNADRPHSAYNVPVTISEPGPDGSLATTGDNTPDHGLQPRPTPAARRPPSCRTSTATRAPTRPSSSRPTSATAAAGR